MRALSTTTIVLVTAGLALLLLAYVFLGGERETPEPEVRCTAREAYDQIKSELFRRAGAYRGASEPSFDAVAGYSIVRPQSQIVRTRAKGGTVRCAGTIALDLPPGVVAIGGRRNLAAKVTYGLALSPNGSAQLRGLSNADAIVQPLASIGRDTASPQPSPPEAEANQAQAAPLSVELPAAAPARQGVTPRATPEARPGRTVPSQRATPPTMAARSPSPRPPAGTQPRTPRAPAVTPAPAAPAVAGVSPSFNCRYARTRGETAVCRNPGLASLDRQMASQFNRALSAAGPGERKILQRTRNGFLRYRDSCDSEACVADAYRGRMREISDIMTRF